MGKLELSRENKGEFDNVLSKHGVEAAVGWFRRFQQSPAPKYNDDEKRFTATAKSFAVHGFVLVPGRDHMPTIEVYLGWNLWQSFEMLRKTKVGVQVLCDCFRTNDKTLEALEIIIPRSSIKSLGFTMDTDAWEIPDRSPYMTTEDIKSEVAATNEQESSHFARTLKHKLSIPAASLLQLAQRKR
ncbi:hypothetical protein LTR17_021211 [Elasticomyces elasticus]|nr:hypothetical protein LTR17_021211 [Elasticomyces elasticus]